MAAPPPRAVCARVARNGLHVAAETGRLPRRVGGEVRVLGELRPDGVVVLVEFRLRPGAADAFWPIVMANARASVRDEPGCRRFDVMTPENRADPDTIWLYEIYDDEAAFAAHLASPHFKEFAAASEALIAARRVLRLDLVEHAKPGTQSS